MTKYEQLLGLTKNWSTNDRLVINAAIMLLSDVANNKFGMDAKNQAQKELGTLAMEQVQNWGVPNPDPKPSPNLTITYPRVTEDSYHVIDTPMRPNRYKVDSVKWPGKSNAITEYFPSWEDAQTECDRRNGVGSKYKIQTFNKNWDTWRDSNEGCIKNNIDGLPPQRTATIDEAVDIILKSTELRVIDQDGKQVLPR